MANEGAQLMSDKYSIDIALVIAIDFGTALSGYAYSYTSNPTDIKLNPNWGADQEFQSYKTRTCLLLKNGVFDSFGYEAEKKYFELNQQKQKEYQFYDRFKMALNKEELWKEEPIVHSITEEPAKALSIFSMSIKYFKTHAFETLSKECVSTVDDNKIRWVITVPAIWCEGAKQLMRIAAYQAGLVTEQESARLVIALEPEVASIYCRNQAVHQYTEETRGNTIEKGTDYLLLDCGGTVDITAHNVIEPQSEQSIQRVREIYSATGGPWGGCSVDDNFETLLNTIFTKEFIEGYKMSSPSCWLSLMKRFEASKKLVSEGDPIVNIELGLDFGENYVETFGKSIKKHLDNRKMEGVSYEQGRLVIKGEKVIALFKPEIKNIIVHIDKLLSISTLNNVKYFFLVGGFSESKLLQNAFRKHFESKVRIVIPQEACIAVLKGAVTFGHNPYAITERIMHHTYGFATHERFKEVIHPPERRYMEGGKAYCECFNVMVKKGKSVKVGEVFKCNTYPLQADQTEFSYNILQTESEDVQFPDEPGVKEIGKLEIISTNTSKGTKRKIVVNFCVGDTEIYVTIADQSGIDGDVQEIKLNFVAGSGDS